MATMHRHLGHTKRTALTGQMFDDEYVKQKFRVFWVEDPK